MTNVLNRRELMRRAVAGSTLLTVPGITQIPRSESSYWYWSFSSLAAERLFRDAFVDGAVDVTSHGNVLAATAFLYWLAGAKRAETRAARIKEIVACAETGLTYAQYYERRRSR